MEPTKLIVDLRILLFAPGYAYAILRKEFETDLVPMVGMDIENSAWKDSRTIKCVTINPAGSYYLVHVDDESGKDDGRCEELNKMYHQHGWQWPGEMR